MKKPILIFFILPLLFAFGKKPKPETSKYLTKHYVLVPLGIVYTELEENKLPKNLTKKELHEAMNNIDYFFKKDAVEPFYCFKTEITNLNYREFINYLPKDERAKMMPDTTVWLNTTGDMRPFKNAYFQHPAYNEYPVVGVTLEQATAYANWLTEIYAMKNQGVTISFSIPTQKQWIRAARGAGTQPYTGGQYLRNSKGVYEINFRQMDGRFIGRDTTGLRLEVKNMGASFRDMDGGTITTPAESYYPNEFGIYQMCGNIAELVSDDTVAMGGSWYDTGYDVRIESEQPATKPSALIGFRVIATITN